MTLIESQSVEVMRLRLDHIERELAQIKTRLKAQPLPEPMPFPVAPRAAPFSESKRTHRKHTAHRQGDACDLLLQALALCSPRIVDCFDVRQSRLGCRRRTVRRHGL